MSGSPSTASAAPPGTKPGRIAQAECVLALLLFVAAAAVYYFAVRLAPPKLDAAPHEAIGQVLAEQAAKLLGPGRAITLIAWDTAVFPNPAADLQIKSFRQALRKSQLKLAATKLIGQDPDRLLRIPPGDFLEMLRKRGEGDVIVSCLGPPLLSAEQKARLANKPPRIVALCSGDLPRQENLKLLFQQDLLHAAIISRPQPAISGPAPQNPRQAFDRLYQVVTSANLSDLPAPGEPHTR